jgi:hypothetical protein
MSTPIHTQSALLDVAWQQHPRNPLIRPPFPWPLIADPTFVTPRTAPDGKWHLFAHSFRGIHHYQSRNGLAWKRQPGVVVGAGIRPFLFHQRGMYHLYYERMLRIWPGLKSRIEVRTSRDLRNWSAPQVVLTPQYGWEREGGRGFGTVGNPCVVAHGEGFRLYYSAGLVRLKDCGFDEPKYIGVATATQPTGPFEVRHKPVLGPDVKDPFSNLGAGAMKVLVLDDGFVGFQNGIYWNEAIGHSGSAIRTLRSDEGINWTLSGQRPIIEPGLGWQRSHVYALDVRRTDTGWCLFYNARNGWRWGREAIGRADAALRSGSENT